MSDDDIKALARRWLGPIRRGDCSVAHAREEAVGEVTYPYADASRRAHVAGVVASVIR